MANKKEALKRTIDYGLWIMVIFFLLPFIHSKWECEFSLKESYVRDVLGINMSYDEYEKWIYETTPEDRLMERLNSTRNLNVNTSLLGLPSSDGVCSCPYDLYGNSSNYNHNVSVYIPRSTEVPSTDVMEEI